MSPRRTKVQREADESARFEATLKSLETTGELDSEVWPEGCGRCGGDLVVHKYAERCSTAHGSAGIEIKALPLCPVCKVDRVKRWGDLMQASASEGKELRDPFARTGSARRLASAGLVRYDNNDNAWELTPEGLALLRRWDRVDEREAVVSI